MAVIILTGHKSKQTEDEGMKYGALAYLTKPCDFEKLLTTILKASFD